MTVNSLQELYVEQLEDVYNAEQQILQALPQIMQAATSPNLKNTLATHFRQTQTHVLRLQQLFGALRLKPGSRVCKAMQGLIEECNDMIKEAGIAEVKDAGLIACVQRIEHYEMAAYGTLRTFAETLGHLESFGILQATLNEEGEADKLLTLIATAVINQNAATASASA